MQTFTVTPVEVIDTAVKIGLGALISAIGTYYLTKLNHNKEAEKLKANRRRELIEEVAERVEKFCQSALKYWVVLADEADPNIPPSTEDEIEEVKGDFIEEFKEVGFAETKLLLIGEKETSKLLRDFSYYVKGFLPVYRSKNKFSLSELEDLRLKLLEKRAEVFDSLHNAYDR